MSHPKKMNDTASRPTCATCPFWSAELAEGESPEDWAGQCRRYAPRAAMDRVIKEQDYSDFPTWPETSGGEWCGDHPDFPNYARGKAMPPRTD